MDIVLIPLFKVLMLLIYTFKWALIIYAALSWLFAFNILNMDNQFIYKVNDFLHRLISPMLRPLRSFIPVIGGLDLSFLALFLLVYFVENMVERIFMRLLM
tara:strand:+ start:5402 stop:5704 length:303 start_codon:yes stop_codon:yes gene_type:complete